MSKITIEVFDTGAEITDFCYDDDKLLHFDVVGREDGYITLGRQTRSLIGGKCFFDLRSMDDGELELFLILKERTLSLWKLFKHAGHLSLSECEGAYIRALSIAERRLEKRVKELEQRLDDIHEKIYGSTIF